jgi:rod shape-determining protein MreD
VSDDYRLRSPADRLRWAIGLWRFFVPAATVLVLIVAMTLPVVLPWPGLPQLGLLGVFVWATFQPGLMPPWLAFLLGLVADLLGAMPFGVEATLFAATALFVRLFEDRFGHHRFGFDWSMLVLVAIVHAVLGWWFLGFAGVDGPFTPLLIQAATTAATYPIVVVLCARVQRRLLA